MTTPRDATALDALQGEISQWAKELSRYKAYAEKFDEENAALQARVKELEAQRDEALAVAKECGLEAQRDNARATRAERKLDEAYERAAKEAENFDHADTWPGCDSDHDLSNVARVIGGETCDAIAAAIRRLAEFKEEK